jgi:hypothetical protein
LPGASLTPGRGGLVMGPQIPTDTRRGGEQDEPMIAPRSRERPATRV